MEGTLQQRQTSPRGFSATASLEGGPFTAGQFMDEGTYAPGAGGQLAGLNDIMALLKQKGRLGIQQQQWLFDEMRRQAAAARNHETIAKPLPQNIATFVAPSPYGMGYTPSTGLEPNAVAHGYMSPQQFQASLAQRPGNAEFGRSGSGIQPAYAAEGGQVAQQQLAALQDNSRPDWFGTGLKTALPQPGGFNPASSFGDAGPGNPTSEFNAWKKKLLMENSASGSASQNPVNSATGSASVGG